MQARYAPLDNLDDCPFCWTDADDAFEEDDKTLDESDVEVL